MSVRFHDLLRAFSTERVRFTLIGVAAANYYASGPAELFATRDRDLFLPLDADNLLRAWNACESVGLELSCSTEPLDSPRDRWLAQRIVERRALTRASDGEDLLIDLVLAMAGFTFEAVWRDHRTFRVDGVDLPVARLRDIVASKAAVGRPKDQLFLETHKETLRECMRQDPDGPRL